MSACRARFLSSLAASTRSSVSIRTVVIGVAFAPTLHMDSTCTCDVDLDVDVDVHVCFLCARAGGSYNTQAEYKTGWRALSRVAMLCNRAEFKAGEELKPILRRCASASASASASVLSAVHTRHLHCPLLLWRLWPLAIDASGRRSSSGARL